MPCTRRDFLKLTGAGACALAATDLAAAGAKPPAGDPRVYVGTYTGEKAEGIYLARMDASTGALRVESVVRDVENPSFLAVDPGGRFLYAVNEVGEFRGRPGGSVSAFRIDPRSGGLRLLNRAFTHGGAPCYVTLDRTNRFVLVANYAGGNVAVLPVRRDGSLENASDVAVHAGSGLDPRRQAGPHAHCIVPDPANRHLYAVDLGLDRILIYRFDAEIGALVPSSAHHAAVGGGGGARHFAFHPGGRFACVINELDSTVTSFLHEPKNGALREIHTVSTLPEGFSGASHCADLHFAPSGRFLYGSNRGHDSIAVFAVDASTGRLSPVQHEPTGGRTPRNFAIDPTGRFLLAANQHSDTVVTFRIDAESGRLTPTGHVAEVPVPVCLRFAPGA